MKFASHRIRIAMGGVALAGITLAVVAAMPAQDANRKPAPAAPAQNAGQPPAGMADMAGMMPNEHHKRLERTCGNWTADVSFSMAEGMPPQKNSGTVEIKSILGGRYILETVHGGPMGPMGNFEGMGISGYNNRTAKYENTWLDNMGTEQSRSTGEDDPATGDIVWRSEAPNMMTSKMEPTRSVMHMKNDNEFTFVTMTTSNGKEWKSMEITYTRAK